MEYTFAAACHLGWRSVWCLIFLVIVKISARRNVPSSVNLLPMLVALIVILHRVSGFFLIEEYSGSDIFFAKLVIMMLVGTYCSVLLFLVDIIYVVTKSLIQKNSVDDEFT